MSITLIAEPVSPDTFAPFGKLYNLRFDADCLPCAKSPCDKKNLDSGHGVVRSKGTDYTDGYTKRPLIDRPGNLGMTQTEAVPHDIIQMERHLHSEEAMMCAGWPVAFIVAPAGDVPAGLHAKAFILSPGQVVVLYKGTWHSPATGWMDRLPTIGWQKRTMVNRRYGWMWKAARFCCLRIVRWGIDMNGYTVFLGDVALDEYYRTDHWPAVGGKRLSIS